MKSCQCVLLLVLESRGIFSWFAHYWNLSCAAMTLAMEPRWESISQLSQRPKGESCTFCVRLHRLLVEFSGPGLTGGLSSFCLNIICLSYLELRQVQVSSLS